jgi:hypothetical protein
MPATLLASTIVDDSLDSICDTIEADPYGTLCNAVGSPYSRPVRTTVEVVRFGRRREVDVEIDVGTLQIDGPRFAQWRVRWIPIGDRAMTPGCAVLQFAALRSIGAAPVQLELLVEPDRKLRRRHRERVARRARRFADDLAASLAAPPE